MANNLPIGDALRFGWEGTKKNFWFLLGLLILFYLVQFGATMFLAFLLHLNEGLQGLAGALGYVVNLASNLVFATGTVAVALKICDGQRPGLGDFICEGKVLGFYFLWLLILVPLLMTGFLLLIVPGVYLAIRLGQGAYFIVEQKDNPIDALKKSWEATQGAAMDLFLYYLVTIAIVFGGLLLLLVGAIPAWFVTMIASAYIYRVLNQRLTSRSPSPSEAPKDPSTPPPVLVESL